METDVASARAGRGKIPFQTEYPVPGWCRSILRLTLDLDGVDGVLVGLKEEGRWITFAAGAEFLSTEDGVRACDLIVGRGGAGSAAGGDGAEASDRIADRRIEGVRLRDDEGRTFGALIALAAVGADMDPPTRRVLAELPALIAPQISAARSSETHRDRGENTTAPALLVRILGKIQPLISEIVATAEMLQREVIGTSRKRAEDIHRNGVDVIRALRSVLELIDAEAHVITSQAQEADLAGIAREELEAHRTLIRKRGLRLELVAPEEPIRVETDVAAVRRIVGIFLANAIAYTREGSITVETTRTTTHDQISVRDTGEGLTPGMRSQVFEPFASESSDGRKGGRGVGLGLAIAKKLADRAGLELAVESRPGEGSRFVVRCPRTFRETSERTASPESGENVRLDVAHRPLILLVEDNAVARRVIEMMVRGKYDIVAASTFDEAMESAREYQFDLLLLDVALKERRTGVEVLHGVRRMVRYQNVPAVVCTANTRPGLPERFLDAGFDAYIGKPFRAQQLLETLADALEQGRRKAELFAHDGDIEIELLPVPSTLPRLLKVVSNDDGAGDPAEVRRILESDPAASSFVLSHVNSAFFSVRGQVGTVERAITLLGAETISNLVMSGLLARTFDSFASDEVRRVHGHIVRVSLATAGFAKILAERVELPNPEMAFAAGLLHDTGRLCMLAHDPDGYARLWIHDDTPLKHPGTGQELLHFDVDHVRVGAHLSREWDLPEELAAVVSMIENPDRVLRKHQSMVSVVAAGRAAAIRLIMDDEQPADLGSALRRLERLHDVPPGELRTLIDERMEEVDSLLKSMRG